MTKRKSLLIYLALTTALILKPTLAPGGSAVASGPYGEHVVVAGPNYRKKAAEQKALALWHSNWSGQPKILASSESGYGAVAAWNNGDTWPLEQSQAKPRPKKQTKRPSNTVFNTVRQAPEPKSSAGLKLSFHTTRT
jgi:hypothetical protein